MAKIDKLVEGAKQLLAPNESIVSIVDGLYTPPDNSDNIMGTGVMLLTDQRIFIYRKTMSGYSTSTISFDDLSAVDLSKAFTGHRLSFSFKSGQKAQMKHIQKGDPQAFLNPSSTPIEAETAVEDGSISQPDKPKSPKKQSAGFRAFKYTVIGIGGLFLITFIIALIGSLNDVNERQRSESHIITPQTEEANQDKPSASAIPTMHTRSGYLASINKDWLDRAVDFSVKGDHAALQQLIDSKMVFPLKAGVEVYIEEGGIFAGIIKIRPKGSNLYLYTVREAVGG